MNQYLNLPIILFKGFLAEDREMLIAVVVQFTIGCPPIREYGGPFFHVPLMIGKRVA